MHGRELVFFLTFILLVAVGRWDDLELPFETVESAAVEHIGYTGDEW